MGTGPYLHCRSTANISLGVYHYDVFTARNGSYAIAFEWAYEE